jgi:hypothetical protein
LNLIHFLVHLWKYSSLDVLFAGLKCSRTRTRFECKTNGEHLWCALGQAEKLFWTLQTLHQLGGVLFKSRRLHQRPQENSPRRSQRSLRRQHTEQSTHSSEVHQRWPCEQCDERKIFSPSVIGLYRCTCGKKELQQEFVTCVPAFFATIFIVIKK